MFIHDFVLKLEKCEEFSWYNLVFMSSVLRIIST